MLRRKKVLLIMIGAILFVATFLNACTKSEPEEQADTPKETKAAAETEQKQETQEPEQAEELQVRVAFYDDSIFEDVIAGDFSSKYPNVEMIYMQSASVDEGTLQALMMSDDAPDVIMMNSGPGRIGPLWEAGMLEDLTEYYQTRGWNAKASSAVLDILSANDYPLVEVCNGMDIFQAYYMKDVFAENGFEVPATWEEFESLCAQMKDAGLVPLAMSAMDSWHNGHLFGNFLQASAGFEEMSNVILGDGEWTSSNVERAFEIYYDFFQKGYIDNNALAIGGMDQYAAVVTKKAGIVFAPQGNLLTFVGEGDLDIDNIGAFNIPSMEGYPAIPTAGLAHSWVVRKGTENLEGALVFMDYLLSGDYYNALAENDFWKYGVAALPINDASNINIVIKNAMESINDGAGYNPSVFVSADVKAAYYRVLQDIVSDTVTPMEAAQQVQEAKAGQ